MNIRSCCLGSALIILSLTRLVAADTMTDDSAREIAKKVSPSVVLLVMEDANGQPLGMGSGFIIRDGVIATNMHVIQGASRGYAKLVGDTRKNNIRGVVASDTARDLVLLSVEGLTGNALAIGNSDEVAVGDSVYAVGNPRGLEGTFSAGIVSSVRKVGDHSLLQITAPVSPGSSGGPVVNSRGQVIGVAVATFKGGQNLNFAIPSRYLSSLPPDVAPPIELPKVAGAHKGKQKKSILDDIGGKTTDGVEGAQFSWTSQIFEDGRYSISLRNKLREPVRNVYCLVVFYDKNNQPLDVSLLEYASLIPPGLAKRISGGVDTSIKRLTTPVSKDNQFLSDFSPNTRLEFRILYFDVVSPDEPIDEQGVAMPDQRK